MNDARKRRLVAALKGKAIEVDHFAELRGPDNPEEARLWLQTRDDLLELVHAYDNPRPRTAAEALEQAFCHRPTKEDWRILSELAEVVYSWDEYVRRAAAYGIDAWTWDITPGRLVIEGETEARAFDYRILDSILSPNSLMEEPMQAARDRCTISLRTDDYDTLLDVLANADTSTQTANDLLAFNDLQYRLQRARDAAYARGAAAKTEDDLTQP